MSINKKAVFTVWYFVLWGISAWALIEYFYPPTNYSAYYLMYVAAAAFSLLLLAATGGPLLSYMKRREIRRKGAMLFLVTFLIATVSLTIFLVPHAYVCAATKSKIQWYIDDVESQGFNAKYSAIYPYGHWHAEWVSSYSNFTSIARGMNCTSITVYGGSPTFFIFFARSRVELVAARVGYGYFIFTDHWS